MPSRALSLVIGLLLAGSAHAAAPPLPLANQELLQSAHTWEARDRGDMAVLALEKLVAARPNSPEVLLELGELYLRMGNIAAANAVLARMWARFPDAPATRTYEIEYRILTRDRLQLASIERLIQVRRYKEAHTALRKLFGDGAPNGVLGLDYYRLLARIPGHEAEARTGIAALAARHPGDSRYQLGLAKNLLRHSQTTMAGMQLLGALAERDDLKRVEVDDALASAFRDVGYGRAPLPVLRSYVVRRPDDAAAKAALARLERRREESELLRRGALASIAAPEQQRNFDAMAASLQQQADQNADAAHAAALAYLLQHRLPPDTPLGDATLLAALWEMRAREAASHQRLELAAAEYEITLALRQRRYEAVIPLAEEIEALGETRQSGELLAAASRLEPGSSWLFATHMRWLIAHEQPDAALTALAARPLDARWSAIERDALRASALEQRARSRMGHSPTEALADLTAALTLAPADPWIRYRLAQLHARRGDPATGSTLMSDGVREYSRSHEMRYAQALYLAGIDDDANALAAVAVVPAAERSAGMQELHERLQVSLARTRARQLVLAGDTPAARAVLLAVEPLAEQRFELARALAFSWISLGDTAHGLGLVTPFVTAAGGDKDTLFGWATVLESAREDEQLTAVLSTLRSLDRLTAAEHTQVARLQRSLDLRHVERLERDGNATAAARALDALLTHAPEDRQLRIARADLDLRMALPQVARDRYATLVAEQPDDLETRLSLVRALTESGDVALARVQLQAVQEHLPADDIELQVTVARRQSALGDFADAATTLDTVLERAPERSDVLVLAAEVQRSLGNYERARGYLVRAEQAPDVERARMARASLDAIDSRRRASMVAATELHSKPGDAGISQFESQLLTTTWRYPMSYTDEVLVHADAVTLAPGKLGDDYDTSALLGTLQVAGPGAPRGFTNDRQIGLSLGTGYTTDALTLDVGTTPLGFTLHNFVGGIEWTPRWRDLDLALRLTRRAVTSSVLSFGGLRDPITGAEWGGVVATGPSLTAGLYRERYSISGALKVTELTGRNVLDNRFIGLRGSTDWEFLSRPETRAYAGVTLEYWRYTQNLGGYTFGHGGYFSPQSYLNVALPVEVQGQLGAWSYRLRASVSQSTSRFERSPFFPTDPALQMAAASSPLPAGFDAPFYEASRGGGFSISAYAAIERQIFGHYVVGGVLDLDRADFYRPTVAMLYLRRRFGPLPLTVAVPPRPTRPYNDD